jgi:excisionase family DNA binding protein
MEKLLTAMETADVLRVSLRTVRTMIARQQLPVVRIGRRTLVKPETLAEVVAQREHGRESNR